MPRIGRVAAGSDLVDELVDEGDRVVAVAAVEVAAGAGGDLAAEVRERGGERSLAEVEDDDRPGVRVERDEGRLLAAGARAHADVDGQAVALEVADQLADARPGQAGQPGDVRAGDRAEVVEGAKDQRGVVRAGLRVGRLGRELGACHGRVAPPRPLVPTGAATILRLRPVSDKAHPSHLPDFVNRSD